MNRLLPNFPLGRIVATPGALQALQEANQNPFEFLERHQTGDWGEICEEDKSENEFSVRNGFRILSAYRTLHDVKVWVITEADRYGDDPPSSPRILALQDRRIVEKRTAKNNEGTSAVKHRFYWDGPSFHFYTH